MKKIVIIFMSLFAISLVQAQITYSPVVDSLINDITEPGILILTRELSGDTTTMVEGAQVVIESRYSFSSFNPISAKWIKEKFEGMGISTVVESFDDEGENVIATIPGSMFPDKEYIVCAHYDDRPDIGLAPGADDNATGVICVLETARLLKDQDLLYTVKFIAWDQEEQGLFGSEYYASNAIANGDDIIGVYNMDMLGYDSDGDEMTSLSVNGNSQPLADDYIYIRDMYEIPLVHDFNWKTNSDHSSFWNVGYRAIQVTEYSEDLNNHYHTSGDDVYNLDMPYYRKQVQAVVATMATLAMDLKMEMFHKAVLSGPSTEPREAWLTISSNHSFNFGQEAPRLYYSTDALSYLSIQPTSYQADTFYFMIPGHEFGTTVYYYLAAQNDNATMVATLPEGGGGINPPGTSRPGEYYSYNVDNTFYLNTCSNTMPKPILDLENTMDTISVSDDWEVEDLDVSVDITHPTVEDVEIYLSRPGVEEIALSVAHGGLGDNYTGTIFDDEAEIHIFDAEPPYSGRFIPEESLSIFDGSTMAGDWIMRVYDNGIVFEGTLNSWCLTFTYSMPVGIQEKKYSDIVLKQNYPNPMLDHTTIEFGIPDAQWVRVTAHNLLGQEVGVLTDQFYEEGRYALRWTSHAIPSGLYFFRFSTGRSVEVMPFLVVRKDSRY